MYSPTAVLPTPVASLTCRTLSFSSCVYRNTSRIFLIDTLFVAIDRPAVLVDSRCRSADSNVDGSYP
jgi:hypothetical protein